MKFNGNGVFSEQIFREILVGARIGINFDEVIITRESESDTKPLLNKIGKAGFEYDKGVITSNAESGGSYSPSINTIMVNMDHIIRASFGIVPEHFGKMQEEVLKRLKKEFHLESLNDFWKYFVIDTIVHEAFHALQCKQTRKEWFEHLMNSENIIIREAFDHFIEEECGRETNQRIGEMVEDGSFRILLDEIPDDIPELCGIKLEDSSELELLREIFPGIDASHIGT